MTSLSVGYRKPYPSTLAAFLVGLLAFPALSGCAFPAQMARNEHAGAYLRNIEEKTASVIEAGAPLRLEDCIRVALQHNLDVTTVEIGARIATLERRTAFANFLPTLDIHLSYAAWDRQPMSQMLGPFAVPTSQLP